MWSAYSKLHFEYKMASKMGKVQMSGVGRVGLLYPDQISMPGIHSI